MTLLATRKEHPQPEEISILIPEARRRTRMRRLVIAAVVVAVLAAGGAVVARSVHNTPPVDKQVKTPRIPPIAPVGIGERLASSTVLGLSMLTPTSGYGVASTQWVGGSDQPRNSFMTFTTNAGSSWKVIAPLPIVLRGPMVAFVSARVGYVAGSQQANSLFVTTDAGHSWHAVSVAGEPLTLTSSGSTVWVTSQVCVAADKGNTSLCPTTLTVFKAGATSPSSSKVIPTASVVLESLKTIDGALTPKVISTQLLTQYGPTSGLASQGGDLANVLVQTTNGGQT